MVQKVKETFNSWESWQKVVTIILSIQAVLIGGIFTFQAVTNDNVNKWIERTAKVENEMENNSEDIKELKSQCSDNTMEINIIKSRLIDVGINDIDFPHSEAVLPKKKHQLTNTNIDNR